MKTLRVSKNSIFCEVRQRRIDVSGYWVLAENVTPDRAAEIISAHSDAPGFVTWRVDRTEEGH